MQGFLNKNSILKDLLYKQRTAGNLLKTVYETLPIALFILLPIFAFLLKLFFFRSGGYANHLVFGFYFFSFLFFVFTVQLIVNSLIDIQDWIDLLVTLSVGIYLTLAIKQFYGTGWSTAILKTAGLTFFLFFVCNPFCDDPTVCLWFYDVLVDW